MSHCSRHSVLMGTHCDAVTKHQEMFAEMCAAHLLRAMDGGQVAKLPVLHRETSSIKGRSLNSWTFQPGTRELQNPPVCTPHQATSC